MHDCGTPLVPLSHPRLPPLTDTGIGNWVTCSLMHKHSNGFFTTVSPDSLSSILHLEIHEVKKTKKLSRYSLRNDDEALEIPTSAYYAKPLCTMLMNTRSLSVACMPSPVASESSDIYYDDPVFADATPPTAMQAAAADDAYDTNEYNTQKQRWDKDN
ncbi:hypothetical protein K438DRAFT_1981505 [Mycena galopus ATCC 62051]|nr:hypothetical protein K438DRAFT_1981505 [Mycena galopus ATCC 62051]